MHKKSISFLWVSGSPLVDVSLHLLPRLCPLLDSPHHALELALQLGLFPIPHKEKTRVSLPWQSLSTEASGKGGNLMCSVPAVERGFSQWDVGIGVHLPCLLHIPLPLLNKRQRGSGVSVSKRTQCSALLQSHWTGLWGFSWLWCVTHLGLVIRSRVSAASQWPVDAGTPG